VFYLLSASILLSVSLIILIHHLSHYPLHLIGGVSAFCQSQPNDAMIKITLYKQHLK